MDVTTTTAARDASTVAPGAGIDVAYVMTHYPQVALTFLSGEVDAVTRLGGRIVPIAINSDDSEPATPDAARRRASTLYLKASPGRIVAATLGAFVAHPFKMMKLIATAIRSARSDVDLIARRLVHVGYAALVAQHCRAHGIQHLHAHFGQAPATIAWFAADIMNFRSRGAAQWSFTIHGFQDFVDETIARLDLKAASAAFVICVSDFTKSQLCRVAAPDDWHKFHVVRCGIDLAAFPARHPKPMRSPPKIVIVGRLSPEKGHLTLLQAVKILADRGTDVEVDIVGAGPFEANIKCEQELLGLGSRILFTGELLPHQVRARLHDADIFCMASFSEGLPISIMEAMAIGVPVVTTWISGIPELAEDGVTAVTVAPGNAEALAAGLTQLIADPLLRETMVVNARAAVERLHNLDTSARAVAGLFEHSLAPVAADRQG